MAGIFVAEIGDVHRFPNPAALASWAGLTPKQHDSDLKEHKRGMSKQGSRLLRWAAMEAVVRYKGGPVLAAKHQELVERRGKNKARVATARRLLHLVYYGLRDGEIRCLARPAA
jgi:transposase